MIYPYTSSEMPVTLINFEFAPLLYFPLCFLPLPFSFPCPYLSLSLAISKNTSRWVQVCVAEGKSCPIAAKHRPKHMNQKG
ncbi:hypothetical protein XENTR_v10000230 [Xenopus tropicalis]|nr:hypothetical protein XENTR_v10000230 [Xenopus tropicalis]